MIKPAAIKARAAMAILEVKNIEKHFEGKCYGRIIQAKEGPYGFGYDPIFVPDGENEPFSRLPDEIKNRISHRGVATKQLMEYLKELLK